MKNSDGGRLLTPEEMLELANQSQLRQTPPGFNNVFGFATEEEDFPAMPAPPVKSPEIPQFRTYCESCGHVDSHAQGCPELDRLRAVAALREMDAEDAEAEAHIEENGYQNQPEAIIPLVRRIGASLLHRAARFVGPGKI